VDFLEGFLLGPIWSDTEYETRRHTTLYWLIGWLACAGYVWLQLKPAVMQPWLDLPPLVPILSFCFLLIALPFASRYYYRLNFFLKLVILLLQLGKLAAAFLAFYQKVLPYYTINLDTLPQDMLDYVNQTIAKATETFATMGKAVGMMVGLAAGGLQVVLTLVGILLAASIIPALYLTLIQLLQRGVDYLAHRTLLRNLDL
jgi:hypothetical protein